MTSKLEQIRRSAASLATCSVLGTVAMAWIVITLAPRDVAEAPDRRAACVGSGGLTLHGQVIGLCDIDDEDTVTLFTEVGGSARQVATVHPGAAGRFKFEGVEQGIVHLMATACGASRIQTHTVVGEGHLGPFVLDPAAGRELAVQVTDSNGFPLRSRVTIEREPVAGDPRDQSPWFPSLSATTDAQGLVRASGLPDGPYRVSASATGYIPALLERIEPTGHDVTVVLVKQASMTITVVTRAEDGTQMPVADAQVRVHQPETGAWLAATSSTDGTATLDALVPGRYMVNANLASQVTYRPVESIVEEGADAQVTVTLRPGLSIVGTVTDATTAMAVDGGCVVASSRSETGKLACSATDAKGRFRIQGLTPGRYTLVTQAAGYHRNRIASVRIKADVVPEPVTVTLKRSLVINGWVTDEDGRPVQGARILPDEQEKLSSGLLKGLRDIHLPVLIPEGPGIIPVGELGVTLWPVPPIPLYTKIGEGAQPSGAAQQLPVGCECLLALGGPREADGITAADGSFSLDGISAGPLRLVVLHPDYATLRSEPVSVDPAGDTPPVELIVTTGGALGGRILDPTGSPIPGAMVWIEGQSAFTPEPIEVGDDGEYLADHVAGKLRVTASCSGYFSTTREVTLEPGTSSTSVDIVLEPEGERVQARILNPWEFPVEGATVTIITGEGGHKLTRSARSDSDGMILFPALPGPLWSIVVSHPEYHTLRTATPPWETYDEPSFKMKFAGGVSGTVKDGWSYLPVTRFTVTVEIGGHRSSLHPFTAGDFEITDLPAGGCNLIIEADGYQGLVEQVQIPQGSGPTEVTNSDLELWLDPQKPGSQ